MLPDANHFVTPSRRTVLRTASWAAPAVALATSSPAFAVSETEEGFTFTADFSGMVTGYDQPPHYGNLLLAPVTLPSTSRATTGHVTCLFHFEVFPFNPSSSSDGKIVPVVHPDGLDITIRDEPHSLCHLSVKLEVLGTSGDFTLRDVRYAMSGFKAGNEFPPEFTEELGLPSEGDFVAVPSGSTLYRLDLTDTTGFAQIYFDGGSVLQVVSPEARAVTYPTFADRFEQLHFDAFVVTDAEGLHTTTLSDLTFTITAAG